MTSGKSRQSSRAAIVAGGAFSASASAAVEKASGMPWAAIAIMLIAFSEFREPSRSTTRAVGRPNRPSRKSSRATRSPFEARRRHAGRHEDFAGGAAFLDGEDAPAAGGELAINAENARFGFVDDFDDAPAIGGLGRRGLRIELDAQHGARAEAGTEAAFALIARSADENARGLALLAPLDGLCDQLAVAIAFEDVGEDEGRQAALAAQDLAAALDRAVGFRDP